MQCPLQTSTSYLALLAELCPACACSVRGQGPSTISACAPGLQVKARGPPAEDDMTIAAHLMRLRDAAGRPLSDARMHAEVSIMFIGGARAGRST